ncbi:LysR family transcriptional regulator [Butyricicoccus porcorum]|nr:LysR family transcriptional regulator [Butyricicoccus porcorum]MDD6985972.1 LysR family transcriptional regulator [Butyricicoccus porcorum]MDY4483805.1 LysR family transcriptional regulator [Butyricicoccus porcorum]
MTLRNLRIFLAVADCGSMSEAAKKMHIAQPSVSGTIGEIEEQYGVRLFERLGRRLYITPTGTQLCEYARHILSMYDAMELRLRNADETDMLRVGATVTVGTCILGGVLQRYISETQNQPPKVVVDNTRVIEQQLLKSELDVAVVEGKITSPDLVTQFMMNDPLALVCARDKNPFGAKKSVRLADLQEIPFILREEGSGTREVFESVMPHINTQWVCNNSEAILRGVEMGFGMTVISRRLASDRLRSGALTEIHVADAELNRQFSIVWHKNKYLGKSMKQFIEVCSQYGKMFGGR